MAPPTGAFHLYPTLTRYSRLVHLGEAASTHHSQ